MEKRGDKICISVSEAFQAQEGAEGLQDQGLGSYLGLKLRKVMYDGFRLDKKEKAALLSEDVPIIEMPYSVEMFDLVFSAITRGKPILDQVDAVASALSVRAS